MNRYSALPAIVVFTALCACSPAAHKAESHGDDHAHTAPHGGALIELGDHVGHLEAVLDAQTGTLDLYVLDGHAENYVRLAAPAVVVHLKWEGLAEPATATLSATASRLTGETVGDSSRFSATIPELKGKSEIDLSIPAIDVGGVMYTDVSAHVQA